MDGRLTGFSKLDRIYTSLPPTLISDMNGSCGTSGCLTDSTFPSDHIPVSARFSELGRSTPDVHRLPLWSLRHASFAYHALDIFNANVDPADHVFDRVAVLKDAISAASRAVMNEVDPLDPGVPPHVRLHWALKAWRASLARQSLQVRRAVEKLPDLLRFFTVSDYVLVDHLGLLALIASLSDQSIDFDLGHIDNDPIVLFR